MPPLKTQRACIRLPCEIQAEIKFSGGNSFVTKKAIISNVSTTGIQILSPSFVATGQKLTACFKIPGQSKETYNAEIMRIESLQGRMIGHYPYALGARFIDFKPKQEKKITSYITGKISCRSWRNTLTWLFLFLAGSELGRVVVHTYLNQKALQPSAWELAAPFVCALFGAGFLLTAASAFLNRKSFTALGLIFTSAGIILATARVALKAPLLFASETGAFIWSYEVIIFAVQVMLIVTLIKLKNYFKKMEMVLANEKISPASGRPTFTIL